MALSTNNPTATNSWKKLEEHFEGIKNASMQEMFKQNDARTDKFNLQWNDFLIDYSKNILLIKLKTGQYYIRH